MDGRRTSKPNNKYYHRHCNNNNNNNNNNDNDKENENDNNKTQVENKIKNCPGTSGPQIGPGSRRVQEAINSTDNVYNKNGNFISLRIGNLQMLLEIGLFKKLKEKKKRNQNCIKSGLFQFLFLQQKM